MAEFLRRRADPAEVSDDGVGTACQRLISPALPQSTALTDTAGASWLSEDHRMKTFQPPNNDDDDDRAFHQTYRTVKANSLELSLFVFHCN